MSDLQVNVEWQKDTSLKGTLTGKRGSLWFKWHPPIALIPCASTRARAPVLPMSEPRCCKSAELPSSSVCTKVSILSPPAPPLTWGYATHARGMIEWEKLNLKYLTTHSNYLGATMRYAVQHFQVFVGILGYGCGSKSTGVTTNTICNPARCPTRVLD